MLIDWKLLLSSPFYLNKSEIRKCLAEWGGELRGTVLDVGCGSRTYRRLLTSCEWYIGLEYNPSMHPDVVGSALELPFAGGRVDHIISIEVLEHLPEPEQALKEMARVSRTGGKLILSTPMTWYLHYEPDDYFRYTRYGLSYLLNKAGYHIVEIEKTGGFWTIVLSRMVEVFFQFFYQLTLPIRWLTGQDRGRHRLAVLLTLPVSLFAVLSRAILESKNSPYVQGWVILAEKVALSNSSNNV